VAANADLSRIYPNVTGIPCLSHALNNTGSSLNIPLAISFVDSMSALVSSSFAAHHLFVEHIGSNVSFSRTRWYSWLESAKTLVENFGNIEQFFNKCEVNDISKQRMAVLRKLYGDDELKIDLAIAYDVGQVLASACYKLESDCIVVHQAFNIVQGVDVTLQQISQQPQLHLPNVRQAILATNQISLQEYQRMSTYQQYALFEIARGKFQPSIDYFRGILLKDRHRAQLKLYEIARFISPYYVRLHEAPTWEKWQGQIRFLTNEMLSKLQHEFPLYKLRCDGVTADIDNDITVFGKALRRNFPFGPHSPKS
jgi:hypothetical protein